MWRAASDILFFVYCLISEKLSEAVTEGVV